VLELVLVFGWVHVKGGRTTARAGEVGRSDLHWDSDLRPRRLNLRVQVPHGSTSPSSSYLGPCWCERMVPTLSVIGVWQVSECVSEVERKWKTYGGSRDETGS
jgi:hypothetical protein